MAVRVLSRLGWLLIGPITLLVLADAISHSGPAEWTIDSLLYWVVVAGTVGTSYVDMRHHVRTAPHDELSMQGWRRYVVGLSAVTLVGWLVAFLSTG